MGFEDPESEQGLGPDIREEEQPLLLHDPLEIPDKLQTQKPPSLAQAPLQSPSLRGRVTSVFSTALSAISERIHRLLPGFKVASVPTGSLSDHQIKEKAKIELKKLEQVSDTRFENVSVNLIYLMKGVRAITDNEDLAKLDIAMASLQLSGVSRIIIQQKILSLVYERVEILTQLLSSAKAGQSKLSEEDVQKLETDIKAMKKWAEKCEIEVKRRAEDEAINLSLITPILVDNILVTFFHISATALDAVGSLCLGLSAAKAAISYSRTRKSQKEYKDYLTILAPLSVGKNQINDKEGVSAAAESEALTKVIDTQLSIKPKVEEGKLEAKIKVVDKLIGALNAGGSVEDFLWGLKMANIDVSKFKGLDQKLIVEKLQDQQTELIADAVQKDSDFIIEQLEKQKVYEEKLKAKQEAVDQLIGAPGTVDDLIVGLKKANIDVSKLIGLDKNLVIEKLKGQNSELVKRAVEKDAEVSIMLRKGLTAFAESKAKIDNSYLSFRVLRDTFKLGFSTTFACIGIVAKVLTTVITSSVLGVLSATGFGLLAVGGTAAIVGSVYFYVKKPNLFMCYKDLVPVRMAYHQFKLFINNWQALSRTKEIEKLGLQLLSSKDEKMKRKVDKLSRELEEINKSMSKTKIDLDKLESRMVDAGWEDYIKATGVPQTTLSTNDITSDEQTQSIESDGQKQQQTVGEVGVKTTQTQLPEYLHRPDDIFAEFLMMSHDKDEQADKLWDLMGVDLKSIRRGNADLAVRGQIALTIKKFYGKDESYVLKLLEAQKERESEKAEAAQTK